MPEEPQDDTQHDSFDPALERLYLKELKELGGDSCRNLLNEMIADCWKRLASVSCRQRKAAMPDTDDALRAFDSLKHRFFSKELEILDLSLPELWRLLKKLSVRTWLSIGSVALPILAALLTAAYSVGAHIGK